MRTVKRVSDWTGVSVRTLQYYDEIGLLKPSSVTEAGYRLYGDDKLEALQQILFYKELDFKLEDIKKMMGNPGFHRTEALSRQRRMLLAKRDRLDGLLALLDQLIKGDRNMSFKEFDMSGYFEELAKFRECHEAEIAEFWGSMEDFDKMTEQFREKEGEIARAAIALYGSVEKYTEAMKKNLDDFPAAMDRMRSLKEGAGAYIRRNEDIMARLTADLARDIASDEIRQTAKELIELFRETTKGMDLGENYWSVAAEGYLSDNAIREVTDKKYGEGASDYIGRVLKQYAV